MLGFYEWLNEAKLSYDKNNVYDLIGIIETITDLNENYIEDLVDDIYSGKKDAVKKYFSKYDEPLRLLKTKLSSLSPMEKKMTLQKISSFEEIRKGYYKFETSINYILTTVKIGESKDTAIKKWKKKEDHQVTLFYDIFMTLL